MPSPLYGGELERGLVHASKLSRNSTGLKGSKYAGKTVGGKVAIVTGAGSPIGLGRAMTEALVGAGARVAMLDNNEE